MTRLAITADLHCDDFGSKIDPATGLNARWVDTIDMARWVANDAAVRQDADALIVAGDFTEQRHPAPWRVAQIGEALDAFDGPQVYLRGNHDGQRADRSIVEVLAGGRPDGHAFSRPGVAVIDDVAIAAIPYLDSHWLRTQPGYETVPEADVLHALAEQYLVVAAGLYAESVALAPHQVLVVHQGLSGGLMSDTQAAFLGDRSLVIDARALGAIGFDAVLAGHFHRHQVLSSQPLVAYAGAPYRTDFGEENQIKGYLVVDVDEADVSWEFVETPARPFVTIREDAQTYDVEGAIVRCLDVPPEVDIAELRRSLEADGAFDVQEIRRRPVEMAESASGLSESLSATEALVAYFAGDPDREPIVELGRELLAEVAS